MKVCVTATGASLDALVDPRFGRAAYFIFVDSETMGIEAVQNPNVSAMGGAGIQSAQLVAQKGVEVVITGALGPNAASALQAAGIQVILGVQGITVRQAVEAFKKGELASASPETTGPAHMGTGGVFAGRGIGRRMGGFGTMPSAGGFRSKEEEMAALREEMEFIKGRLEYITKRLQELEKK